jgi:hypothetical protein
MSATQTSPNGSIRDTSTVRNLMTQALPEGEILGGLRAADLVLHPLRAYEQDRMIDPRAYIPTESRLFSTGGII